MERGVPDLDKVEQLERLIPQVMPTLDIDSLTTSHFCKGLYARELFIPKGSVIVGKRHAEQNFFLLAKGELTVSTPTGMKRIKAPFLAVTKPGEKRVGYAHEDSVTFNFHPNPDDCTDMQVLEMRYIANAPGAVLLERSDP